MENVTVNKTGENSFMLLGANFPIGEAGNKQISNILLYIKVSKDLFS